MGDEFKKRKNCRRKDLDSIPLMIDTHTHTPCTQEDHSNSFWKSWCKDKLVLTQKCKIHKHERSSQSLCNVWNACPVCGRTFHAMPQYRCQERFVFPQKREYRYIFCKWPNLLYCLKYVSFFHIYRLSHVNTFYRRKSWIIGRNLGATVYWKRYMVT